MPRSQERMELEVLKKHGASIREMARATGWSRNAMRRDLREGEVVAVRRPAPKRNGNLDPLKAYIVAG
jgi:transposase